MYVYYVYICVCILYTEVTTTITCAPETGLSIRPYPLPRRPDPTPHGNADRGLKREHILMTNRTHCVSIAHPPITPVQALLVAQGTDVCFIV